MTRQTLIHLHGTTRLSDASKLNLGEIAVRNAETAADTELAVLTSGKTLVYIPSIDKVNGITNPIANRVSTLETTVGDADKGLVKDVADLKTAVGEGGSVATQIATAIAAISGNTSDSDDKGFVTVAFGQDKGKVTGLTVTTNDIASAGELSALAETVGDADNGLVKDVAALKTAVGTTDVATQITTAIQGLDASKEGSADHVTVKVDQVDGVITGVSVKTNDIASASELAALDTKVTTLIGKDGDKSVRMIANEELAAQLIPSGATEALDTLQEIAAWIQEHPEDASAMNAKIGQLELTLAGYSSASTVQNAVNGVSTRVSTLETTVGDKDSGLVKDVAALKTAVGTTDVATQITTAIKGLDASKEGSADHVTVKVDQVDGVITGVSVKTNDIASASALSGVKTTADSAVQTIVIGNTATNKITTTKEGTTVTFNFDNIVIDCGTY